MLFLNHKKPLLLRQTYWVFAACSCEQTIQHKNFVLKLGGRFWSFPGAMKCTGLCLKWEQCAELRERLRTTKELLVDHKDGPICLPNRPNAVANAMVLSPVLSELANTSRFRLPHLDDLSVEVTSLFEKCGLSLGSKAIYKSSVEIKKLAGFVKRRCARKEVTKEMG